MRRDAMSRVLAGPSRFLLPAALLLAAATAFAQRTTGSIVGTVLDESGAVLSGVSVSIKGPNIVGEQSSTTNERGFYRFPALPPGTYTLTFTMAGFTTLHHQNVRVQVGQIADENASLKLSQMAEEVTVTGTTEVLNTSSNQVSTNYNQD